MQTRDEIIIMTTKNAMTIEEINPTAYYSPRKLVDMKVLPWASAMTFSKRLKEEKWIALFNPIVETRNGRIYMHIKGENIIKVLELAANGKLNTTDEK
jgi:hypothetical protein